MFLVCRDLSTGMDSEDEMLKHSHSVSLIVSYISLLFHPPLVSSDAFLNLYSKPIHICIWLILNCVIFFFFFLEIFPSKM